MSPPSSACSQPTQVGEAAPAPQRPARVQVAPFSFSQPSNLLLHHEIYFRHRRRRVIASAKASPPLRSARCSSTAACKVVLQKFDPYLNVDPGTMNPFQHGEVYVLDDGAETDLDLGHYERFTHCVLSRKANSTPAARSTRPCSRRSGAAITSARPCRSSRTSPTRSRRASARARRRAGVRHRHHRDRRHHRRHRGAAFSRGDPPVHPRSRAAERDHHARHARALHQGRGRAEDEAFPAIHRQAARDRPAAADAHLPHRASARRGRARQALAVLQRAARCRDRGRDVEHTIYECR